MRRRFRITLCIVATTLIIFGCSGEKKSSTEAPVSTSATAGRIAHWEMDREFARYQPDGESSAGYIEIGKSPDASWGIQIATGRVTTRSHPASDLLITVQDGTARFHIGQEEFTAQTGSLLSVPRGTPYGVDPVSSRELHLVEWFTPALSLDGTKFLEPPGRSAGKLVKRLGGGVSAGDGNSGSGQGAEDEFLNMKDYEEDGLEGK